MTNKREIARTLRQYFDYDGMLYIHDNLVSIKGNCRLKKRVDQLPIKFETITGDFIINNNSLTSLEGSPKNVGGNFDCRNNNLTSLKGTPSIIGGIFRCDKNKLTSLHGAPYKTNSFSCPRNNLTTLKGAPSVVKGWFDCGRNDTLISLDGIPKSVNGAFYITVYPNTPLLKILNVADINKFTFFDTNDYYIDSLGNLFKEHYGKKNAIMKVGLEMIRLGYGSNARL